LFGRNGEAAGTFDFRVENCGTVFQEVEAFMPVISRRVFLQRAATQAAAASFLVAGALELRANPLGLPIGCQTWPVRAMIEKDFPGTIKTLADAGFQRIELCSPAGYAGFGFGSLAKYKGAEIRKILSDTGVGCESSHFNIKELRANQDASIAWAKDVGLKQMIVPSLEGPKNPTLDDVKRAADEYNKMGERAANAGVQQGLHNEDFELSKADGKRTYDLLLGLLDPKLVKFQFQVSTISEGYDAAEYFRKYPGRFFSMHVQGWSTKTRKMMPVGQDALDWKNIFTAAKTGGVKNYFVEMDLEKMKASVPYLRKLEV
jgi:sugar phosphate isomerase/epimerase